MAQLLRTRSRVMVTDYPPGATYGPRVSSDHELLWLLTGSARWRVDRRNGHPPITHDLRPGMLALARAGWCDEFWWDPVVPTRHAYVHFDGPSTDVLPPIADWPVVTPMASSLLHELTDHLTAITELPTAAARRRSDLVVELLVDLVVTGTALAPEGVGGPVGRALDHVVREWRAAGMRLISVDELATVVHVSARQLFRAFATTYGCGPAAALELVRLSRAASLLLRSNESVTRVATVTGFANAYHFSRRFKQAYGMPPSQFRSSDEADPMAPVRTAGLGPLAQRLRAAVP
ncbi:helix-turn-helix transcriptional regulator [Propionibacteriaceae bacterium Y2011]